MNENSNKTFYAKAVKGNNEIKFSELFRDVFKRHSEKDLEKVLSAGLEGNIPSTNDMLSLWQRPWVFFRFFIISALAFGLIWFIRVAVNGIDMISIGATFIMGAVIVPISLVLFFYESNIQKNIPLYKVIGYMFIGGIFESVLCIVLYDFFSIIDSDSIIASGMIPGIIEEITKLVIVSIIIGKSGSKSGLNGLLIGAAVGAGFGFFETNGYAINTMVQALFVDNTWDFIIEQAQKVLLIRALSAIDGHTVFAAIYGCALGLVKGKEKLNINHFLNPVFIVSFFSAIVIHSIWDIVLDPLFIDKYVDTEAKATLYDLIFNRYHLYIVIFGVVIYALIWWLMKLSFKQVISAAHPSASSAMPQQSAPVQNERAAAPAMRIECLSGEYTGSTFSLGYAKPISIGRAPDCGIRFAEDTKGISGHHCEVGIDSEGIYIKDLNSSYGTFIASGEKLQPNMRRHLNVGDVFWLASDKCKFKVV